MTPKFSEVLEMAVEQGVLRGLNQFYKHRDDAPHCLGELDRKISEEVMNSIYEWFDFEDGV